MRATSLYFLVGLWAVDLAGCGGDSYRLGGLADSREGSGGAAAEGGTAAGTGGNGGAGGSDAGSSGAGGAAGIGGAAGGSALTQDVEKIVQLDGYVNSVEADEEFVYFNVWGRDVLRVDHSGLGLRHLAETESFFMIADETHLYWTTSSDIRRVPKAGGATEVVMTLGVPAGASLPAFYLAVDATHVFVSTYADGKVVRAPKTGGTPEIVARTEDTMGAIGAMGGIAVVDGSLFWADYEYVGNVYRTEIESGVTSLFFPNGAGRMQVVGDDLWILPVTDEMVIVRAPIAGGETKRYPFGDYSTNFSSDGLHVYWCSDALMRINLATDAVEKVADVYARPAGLAVTQHFIFVGDEGIGLNGGIHRISKPPP